MSEFHTIDSEFIDKQCLMDSLAEMGYKPVDHEQSVQLYGYQGDQRTQRANIVIPRSQVGSASNDVGFEFVDGRYRTHISEFDQSMQKFNLNKLKALYAEKVVEKTIRNSGQYSITSSHREQDGTKVLKISSFY